MRRLQIILLAVLFGSVSVSLAEDRSFDGSGNNLSDPALGAAGTAFMRMMTPEYADGMDMMAGTNRPNARLISNAVCLQSNDVANSHNLSDMVWQWGQFIDHDIVLSKAEEEFNPIIVPTGDFMFDPLGSGSVMLPFTRTEMMPGTGGSTPREQVNSNSHFIDGSMIYGSSAAVANALRTFVGGKMLMGADDLPPRNIMGVPVDNPTPLPDSDMFAAGDIRINEHAGLTAMHTLFLREHNRLCDELAVQHPGWTDEQLYQRARKVVGAILQAVTYNEWLPALLGSYAPGSSGTYDPSVDPSIANAFAAAFFRVGHTMINRHLVRIEPDNLPASGGDMALKDVFFNPFAISSSDECERYLKGLAARRMQDVDTRVVEDVRSFLFGAPGAGGLDLGALNIQRGRDHGLPDYNSLRVAYGIAPRLSFAEICSDTNMTSSLEALYTSVDDIDPWIGGLAEDHAAGSAVGELIAVALAEQFVRLRDGDRFFYTFDPEFTAAEVSAFDATRLADVIRRNTTISRLQDDVFTVIPEAEVAIASLEQGAFRLNLEWMTDPSATYQIEVSTDIDSAGWNPLSAPFDGNGAMNSFITVNGGPQLRFYRLRQYP